jgi:uncharacterized protein
MIREIEIRLLPEDAADEEKIMAACALSCDVSVHDIFEIRIVRKTIDARRNVKVVCKVMVGIREKLPAKIPFQKNYQNVSDSKKVIIVGAGPCGLFAALKLLEHGIKPIIIERGKDVKSRRRDLAAINKDQIVNPESNYCFGEGGAGTYSDGKLYTRSDKRGNVRAVLETFVFHGADENILIDAYPHIGTNKLPDIITNIRETILQHGGEIHFNTKLVDILIDNNSVKGIRAKENESEKEFLCDQLILATGHSARDVFVLLAKKNILVEPKTFAIGVRIEHPQSLIDTIQYHCENEKQREQLREFLPASSYNLAAQIENRGVYSFCMCPGGIIAPCATQQNEIVTNGWSPSKRNNPFANSGIVVSVEADDLIQWKKSRRKNNFENEFLPFDSLTGIAFQKETEFTCWKAGGETQTAPAQRMIDFIENKLSTDLPKNSYQPGVKSTMLKEVLPDFVFHSLQNALKDFGKKMKGYLTNEAILVAPESRTSSPVRIPRNEETMQHPRIKNLFPCGEGAGFAGGIVSAAMDGMKAAAIIAGE